MLEDIVEEAKEAHERDKAAVPFLKGFLCSPVPLVDFPQVRSFAPQVGRVLRVCFTCLHRQFYQKCLNARMHIQWNLFIVDTLGTR